MDFAVTPSRLKPNKSMMKYREFIRNLFKRIYANGNRIKLVHANWNESSAKHGIKSTYETLKKTIRQNNQRVIPIDIFVQFRHIRCSRSRLFSAADIFAKEELLQQIGSEIVQSCYLINLPLTFKIKICISW